MNGTSHLLLRSGTYYFQRRVPDDLYQFLSAAKPSQLPSGEFVSYFEGKTHIRLSLKTKDKREAARLCREESFKFDNHADKLRNWIAHSGRSTFDDVSPETIKAMAQSALSRWLREDDDRRLGTGLSHSDIESIEVGLDEFEGNFREALATGRYSDLAPQATQVADDLLDEYHFRLDKKSPAYALLASELVKAFLHYSEAVRARNRGEGTETPAEPQVQPSAPPKGSMSLDQLVTYWKGQAARNWKTIYDVETAVKEFKALHGDITIEKISKEQVIEYRDWLLGIGVAEGAQKTRSTKTIEKRLAMLKAVLQTAVDSAKLKFNPASGVKVAQTEAATSDEDREPFSLEDLKKIFSSPVYSEGKRYTQGRGEAQFWLPLIALYTGMRREEIGQLLRSDVQQDGATGIWFFLTKAGSGKRLKNRNSKRRIPIHPDLVKIGLVDYCETIKDGQLFPELRRVGQKGLTTAKWGDWFGGKDGYLRTVIGITDPEKVFHSFRHNFKDAARIAGLEEEVHDALTGHSNEKIGRTYGAGFFPLEPLYEAVKKISFKGLDLSHLMAE